MGAVHGLALHAPVVLLLLQAAPDLRRVTKSAGAKSSYLDIAPISGWQLCPPAADVLLLAQATLHNLAHLPALLGVVRRANERAPPENIVRIFEAIWNQYFLFFSA